MKWSILLVFLTSCSLAPIKTYDCGVTFENAGGKEYVHTHTEATNVNEAVQSLNERFPDHTSICCGVGASCAAPSWTNWNEK
jgi:hypothetical protein